MWHQCDTGKKFTRSEYLQIYMSIVAAKPKTVIYPKENPTCMRVREKLMKHDCCWDLKKIKWMRRKKCIKHVGERCVHYGMLMINYHFCTLTCLFCLFYLAFPYFTFCCIWGTKLHYKCVPSNSSQLIILHTCRRRQIKCSLNF